MFTRGSRYEALPDAEHAAADGRVIRHKTIRFLPQPAGSGSVAVEEGDRPDLLAFRVAQDPDAWWRLADINGTMRPVDLTATPGKRVKLPRTGG